MDIFTLKHLEQIIWIKNTINYASSDSYEYVDGMSIKYTFSKVSYHADSCVLCSSRWHIKHPVREDGTAQGGKYWVLLQGNTRRRLVNRVRVTTEPSSHMSNKSILIDSHRLNNVKICFVSCFSEIRVPHSSSFSVSFFCFLWFWEFFTKNTVFYFVFQVFVVLLNQPGSTEECAKTAAEFQCHLRTQHSTESRGQYLTGFFVFYEQYGIHSLKLSISYVI